STSVARCSPPLIIPIAIPPAPRTPLFPYTTLFRSQCVARGGHGLGGFPATGKFGDQLRGGNQRVDAADAQVVGVGGHAGAPGALSRVSRRGLATKKAARVSGGFRGVSG